MGFPLDHLGRYDVQKENILIATLVFSNYQHSPCLGSTLLWTGCLVVDQSSILNEATKQKLHWTMSRTERGTQRGWTQSTDWSSQSPGGEGGCCFFWWKRRVQIPEVNYVGAAIARRWQVADNWDSSGGTPPGIHLSTLKWSRLAFKWYLSLKLFTGGPAKL